jgi:hypothetical protein
VLDSTRDLAGLYPPKGTYYNSRMTHSVGIREFDPGMSDWYTISESDRKTPRVR